MEKAIFFCDESGSTGTNWADAEQPIFSYGGWLVLDSNIPMLVQELNSYYSDRSKADEIKSKVFFKRGDGTKRFDDVFSILLNHQALPVFTITDKRFIIMAKIIETFFDSAYNQKLNPSIIGDTIYKKKMAEYLYDKIPNPIFTKIIRSGTPTLEIFHQAKNELAQAFVQAPSIHKNISQLNDDELTEMVDELTSKNTSRSLTVPLLYQLMQHIQLVAGGLDWKVNIQHDNIRGYDDWLDDLRNICFPKNNDVIHVIEGENFTWHSKLSNVYALELCDSRSSVLIQSADLLCGFLTRSLIKLKNDVDFDKYEEKVWKSLVALHDNINSWDYVLPEKLLLKCLSSCGLPVKQVEPPTNLYIEEKFKKHLKKPIL